MHVSLLSRMNVREQLHLLLVETDESERESILVKLSACSTSHFYQNRILEVSDWFECIFPCCISHQLSESRYAILVLASISENSDSHASFLSNGVVRRLLPILSTSTDDQICTLLCLLISNLSVSPEFYEEMLALNAINVLFSMLSSDCASELRNTALLALLHLSNDLNHRKRMIELAIDKFLISSMVYSDDQSLASSFARCLVHLSRDPYFQKGETARTLLPQIATILQQDNCSEELMLHLAGIASNLSIEPSLLPFFVTSEGLGMIEFLSKFHSEYLPSEDVIQLDYNDSFSRSMSATGDTLGSTGTSEKAKKKLSMPVDHTPLPIHNKIGALACSIVANICESPFLVSMCVPPSTSTKLSKVFTASISGSFSVRSVDNWNDENTEDTELLFSFLHNWIRSNCSSIRIHALRAILYLTMDPQFHSRLLSIVNVVPPLIEIACTMALDSEIRTAALYSISSLSGTNPNSFVISHISKLLLSYGISKENAVLQASLEKLTSKQGGAFFVDEHFDFTTSLIQGMNSLTPDVEDHLLLCIANLMGNTTLQVELGSLSVIGYLTARLMQLQKEFAHCVYSSEETRDFFSRSRKEKKSALKKMPGSASPEKVRPNEKPQIAKDLVLKLQHLMNKISIIHQYLYNCTLHEKSLGYLINLGVFLIIIGGIFGCANTEVLHQRFPCRVENLQNEFNAVYKQKKRNITLRLHDCFALDETFGVKLFNAGYVYGILQARKYSDESVYYYLACLSNVDVCYIGKILNAVVHKDSTTIAYMMRRDIIFRIVTCWGHRDFSFLDSILLRVNSLCSGLDFTQENKRTITASAWDTLSEDEGSEKAYQVKTEQSMLVNQLFYSMHGDDDSLVQLVDEACCNSLSALILSFIRHESYDIDLFLVQGGAFLLCEMLQFGDLSVITENQILNSLFLLCTKSQSARSACSAFGMFSSLIVFSFALSEVENSLTYFPAESELTSYNHTGQKSSFYDLKSSTLGVSQSDIMGGDSMQTSVNVPLLRMQNVQVALNILLLFAVRSKAYRKAIRSNSGIDLCGALLESESVRIQYQALMLLRELLKEKSACKMLLRLLDGSEDDYIPKIVNLLPGVGENDEEFSPVGQLAVMCLCSLAKAIEKTSAKKLMLLHIPHHFFNLFFTQRLTRKSASESISLIIHLCRYEFMISSLLSAIDLPAVLFQSFLSDFALSLQCKALCVLLVIIRGDSSHISASLLPKMQVIMDWLKFAVQEREKANAKAINHKKGVSRTPTCLLLLILSLLDEASKASIRFACDLWERDVYSVLVSILLNNEPNCTILHVAAVSLLGLFSTLGFLETTTLTRKEYQKFGLGENRRDRQFFSEDENERFIRMFAIINDLQDWRREYKRKRQSELYILQKKKQQESEEPDEGTLQSKGVEISMDIARRISTSSHILISLCSEIDQSIERFDFNFLDQTLAATSRLLHMNFIIADATNADTVSQFLAASHDVIVEKCSSCQQKNIKSSDSVFELNEVDVLLSTFFLSEEERKQVQHIPSRLIEKDAEVDAPLSPRKVEQEMDGEEDVDVDLKFNDLSSESESEGEISIFNVHDKYNNDQAGVVDNMISMVWLEKYKEKKKNYEYSKNEAARMRDKKRSTCENCRKNKKALVREISGKLNILPYDFHASNCIKLLYISLAQFDENNREMQNTILMKRLSLKNLSIMISSSTMQLSVHANCLLVYLSSQADTLQFIKSHPYIYHSIIYVLRIGRDTSNHYKFKRNDQRLEKLRYAFALHAFSFLCTFLYQHDRLNGGYVMGSNSTREQFMQATTYGGYISQEAMNANVRFVDSLISQCILSLDMAPFGVRGSVHEAKRNFNRTARKGVDETMDHIIDASTTDKINAELANQELVDVMDVQNNMASLGFEVEEADENIGDQGNSPEENQSNIKSGMLYGEIRNQMLLTIIINALNKEKGGSETIPKRKIRYHMDISIPSIFERNNAPVSDPLRPDALSLTVSTLPLFQLELQPNIFNSDVDTNDSFDSTQLIFSSSNNERSRVMFRLRTLLEHITLAGEEQGKKAISFFTYLILNTISQICIHNNSNSVSTTLLLYSLHYFQHILMNGITGKLYTTLSILLVNLTSKPGDSLAVVQNENYEWFFHNGALLLEQISNFNDDNGDEYDTSTCNVFSVLSNFCTKEWFRRNVFPLYCHKLYSKTPTNFGLFLTHFQIWLEVMKMTLNAVSDEVTFKDYQSNGSSAAIRFIFIMLSYGLKLVDEFVRFSTANGQKELVNEENSTAQSYHLLDWSDVSTFLFFALMAAERVLSSLSTVLESEEELSSILSNFLVSYFMILDSLNPTKYAYDKQETVLGAHDSLFHVLLILLHYTAFTVSEKIVPYEAKFNQLYIERVWNHFTLINQERDVNLSLFALKSKDNSILSIQERLSLINYIIGIFLDDFWEVEGTEDVFISSKKIRKNGIALLHFNKFLIYLLLKKIYRSKTNHLANSGILMECYTTSLYETYSLQNNHIDSYVVSILHQAIESVASTGQFDANVTEIISQILLRNDMRKSTLISIIDVMLLLSQPHSIVIESSLLNSQEPYSSVWKNREKASKLIHQFLSYLLRCFASVEMSEQVGIPSNDFFVDWVVSCLFQFLSNILEKADYAEEVLQSSLIFDELIPSIMKLQNLRKKSTDAAIGGQREKVSALNPHLCYFLFLVFRLRSDLRDTKDDENISSSQTVYQYPSLEKVMGVFNKQSHELFSNSLIVELAASSEKNSLEDIGLERGELDGKGKHCEDYWRMLESALHYVCAYSKKVYVRTFTRLASLLCMIQILEYRRSAGDKEIVSMAENTVTFAGLKSLAKEKNEDHMDIVPRIYSLLSVLLEDTHILWEIKGEGDNNRISKRNRLSLDTQSIYNIFREHLTVISMHLDNIFLHSVGVTEKYLLFQELCDLLFDLHMGNIKKHSIFLAVKKVDEKIQALKSRCQIEMASLDKYNRNIYALVKAYYSSQTVYLSQIFVANQLCVLYPDSGMTSAVYGTREEVLSFAQSLLLTFCFNDSINRYFYYVFYIYGELMMEIYEESNAVEELELKHFSSLLIDFLSKTSEKQNYNVALSSTLGNTLSNTFSNTLGTSMSTFLSTNMSKDGVTDPSKFVLEKERFDEVVLECSQMVLKLICLIVRTLQATKNSHSIISADGISVFYCQQYIIGQNIHTASIRDYLMTRIIFSLYVLRDNKKIESMASIEMKPILAGPSKEFSNVVFQSIDTLSLILIETYFCFYISLLVQTDSTDERDPHYTQKAFGVHWSDLLGTAMYPCELECVETIVTLMNIEVSKRFEQEDERKMLIEIDSSSPHSEIKSLYKDTIEELWIKRSILFCLLEHPIFDENSSGFVAVEEFETLPFIPINIFLMEDGTMKMNSRSLLATLHVHAIRSIDETMNMFAPSVWYHAAVSVSPISFLMVMINVVHHSSELQFNQYESRARQAICDLIVRTYDIDGCMNHLFHLLRRRASEFPEVFAFASNINLTENLDSASISHSKINDISAELCYYDACMHLVFFIYLRFLEANATEEMDNTPARLMNIKKSTNKLLLILSNYTSYITLNCEYLLVLRRNLSVERQGIIQIETVIQKRVKDIFLKVLGFEGLKLSFSHYESLLIIIQSLKSYAEDSFLESDDKATFLNDSACLALTWMVLLNILLPSISIEDQNEHTAPIIEKVIDLLVGSRVIDGVDSLYKRNKNVNKEFLYNLNQQCISICCVLNTLLIRLEEKNDPASRVLIPKFSHAFCNIFKWVIVPSSNELGDTSLLELEVLSPIISRKEVIENLSSLERKNYSAFMIFVEQRIRRYNHILAVSMKRKKKNKSEEVEGIAYCMNFTYVLLYILIENLDGDTVTIEVAKEKSASQSMQLLYALDLYVKYLSRLFKGLKHYNSNVLYDIAIMGTRFIDSIDIEKLYSEEKILNELFERLLSYCNTAMHLEKVHAVLVSHEVNIVVKALVLYNRFFTKVPTHHIHSIFDAVEHIVLYYSSLPRFKDYLISSLEVVIESTWYTIMNRSHINSKLSDITSSILQCVEWINQFLNDQKYAEGNLERINKEYEGMKVTLMMLFYIISHYDTTLKPCTSITHKNCMGQIVCGVIELESLKVVKSEYQYIALTYLAIIATRREGHGLFFGYDAQSWNQFIEEPLRSLPRSDVSSADITVHVSCQDAIEYVNSYLDHLLMKDSGNGKTIGNSTNIFLQGMNAYMVTCLAYYTKENRENALSFSQFSTLFTELVRVLNNSHDQENNPLLLDLLVWVFLFMWHGYEDHIEEWKKVLGNDENEYFVTLVLKIVLSSIPDPLYASWDTLISFLQLLWEKVRISSERATTIQLLALSISDVTKKLIEEVSVSRRLFSKTLIKNYYMMCADMHISDMNFSSLNHLRKKNLKEGLLIFEQPKNTYFLQQALHYLHFMLRHHYFADGFNERVHEVSPELDLQLDLIALLKDLSFKNSDYAAKGVANSEIIRSDRKGENGKEYEVMDGDNLSNNDGAELLGSNAALTPLLLCVHSITKIHGLLLGSSHNLSSSTGVELLEHLKDLIERACLCDEDALLSSEGGLLIISILECLRMSQSVIFQSLLSHHLFEQHSSTLRDLLQLFFSLITKQSLIRDMHLEMRLMYVSDIINMCFQILSDANTFLFNDSGNDTHGPLLNKGNEVLLSIANLSCETIETILSLASREDYTRTIEWNYWILEQFYRTVVSLRNRSIDLNCKSLIEREEDVFYSVAREGIFIVTNIANEKNCSRLLESILQHHTAGGLSTSIVEMVHLYLNRIVYTIVETNYALLLDEETHLHIYSMLQCFFQYLNAFSMEPCGDDTTLSRTMNSIFASVHRIIMRAIKEADSYEVLSKKRERSHEMAVKLSYEFARLFALINIRGEVLLDILLRYENISKALIDSVFCSTSSSEETFLHPSNVDFVEQPFGLEKNLPGSRSSWRHLVSHKQWILLTMSIIQNIQDNAFLVSEASIIESKDSCEADCFIREQQESTVKVQITLFNFILSLLSSVEVDSKGMDSLNDAIEYLSYVLQFYVTKYIKRRLEAPSPARLLNVSLLIFERATEERLMTKSDILRLPTLYCLIIIFSTTSSAQISTRFSEFIHRSMGLICSPFDISGSNTFSSSLDQIDTVPLSGPLSTNSTETFDGLLVILASISLENPLIALSPNFYLMCLQRTRIKNVVELYTNHQTETIMILPFFKYILGEMIKKEYISHIEICDYFLCEIHSLMKDPSLHETLYSPILEDILQLMRDSFSPIKVFGLISNAAVYEKGEALLQEKKTTLYQQLLEIQERLNIHTSLLVKDLLLNIFLVLTVYRKGDTLDETFSITWNSSKDLSVLNEGSMSSISDESLRQVQEDYEEKRQLTLLYSFTHSTVTASNKVELYNEWSQMESENKLSQKHTVLLLTLLYQYSMFISSNVDTGRIHSLKAITKGLINGGNKSFTHALSNRFLTLFKFSVHNVLLLMKISMQNIVLDPAYGEICGILLAVASTDNNTIPSLLNQLQSTLNLYTDTVLGSNLASKQTQWESDAVLHLSYFFCQGNWRDLLSLGTHIPNKSNPGFVKAEHMKLPNTYDKKKISKTEVAPSVDPVNKTYKILRDAVLSSIMKGETWFQDWYLLLFSARSILDKVYSVYGAPILHQLYLFFYAPARAQKGLASLQKAEERLQRVSQTSIALRSSLSVQSVVCKPHLLSWEEIEDSCFYNENILINPIGYVKSYIGSLIAIGGGKESLEASDKIVYACKQFLYGILSDPGAEESHSIKREEQQRMHSQTVQLNESISYLNTSLKYYCNYHGEYIPQYLTMDVHYYLYLCHCYIRDSLFLDLALLEDLITSTLRLLVEERTTTTTSPSINQGKAAKEYCLLQILNISLGLHQLEKHTYSKGEALSHSRGEELALQVSLLHSFSNLYFQEENTILNKKEFLLYIGEISRRVYSSLDSANRENASALLHSMITSRSESKEIKCYMLPLVMYHLDSMGTSTEVSAREETDMLKSYILSICNFFPLEPTLLYFVQNCFFNKQDEILSARVTATYSEVKTLYWRYLYHYWKSVQPMGAREVTVLEGEDMEESYTPLCNNESQMWLFYVFRSIQPVESLHKQLMILFDHYYRDHNPSATRGGEVMKKESIHKMIQGFFGSSFVQLPLLLSSVRKGEEESFGSKVSSNDGRLNYQLQPLYVIFNLFTMIIYWQDTYSNDSSLPISKENSNEQRILQVLVQTFYELVPDTFYDELFTIIDETQREQSLSFKDSSESLTWLWILKLQLLLSNILCRKNSLSASVSPQIPLVSQGKSTRVKNMRAYYDMKWLYHNEITASGFVQGGESLGDGYEIPMSSTEKEVGGDRAVWRKSFESLVLLYSHLHYLPSENSFQDPQVEKILSLHNAKRDFYRSLLENHSFLCSQEYWIPLSTHIVTELANCIETYKDEILRNMNTVSLLLHYCENEICNTTLRTEGERNAHSHVFVFVLNSILSFLVEERVEVTGPLLTLLHSFYSHFSPAIASRVKLPTTHLLGSVLLPKANYTADGLETTVYGIVVSLIKMLWKTSDSSERSTMHRVLNQISLTAPTLEIKKKAILASSLATEF